MKQVKYLLILPNISNPHVTNSIKNRIKLYICIHFGCIKTGSYYNMPQAYCRRCGHKNEGICDPDYPEYSKPF